MPSTFQLGVDFDPDIKIIVEANAKNINLVNLCVMTQVLRILQKKDFDNGVVVDASSASVASPATN